MNKRELQFLEKCFNAEVYAGVKRHPIDLFQSKGKLAEKLANEGYVTKHRITLGGRFPVTIDGYRLTHLGRVTYCTTCTLP